MMQGARGKGREARGGMPNRQVRFPDNGEMP